MSDHKTTALVLPKRASPIPDGWWQHTAVPAIARMTDMQDVHEVARRLQALERYVQDRAQRFELRAARLMAEVRIGELLGPGKPGRPETEETTLASVVSRDDRAKFRLLASHKAEVVRLLREERVGTP